MTITIECKGLTCEKEIELPNPEGFVGDDTCEIYCEQCKPEMEFFNDVCPGCVSGFPDCGLGKSFMFSKFEITDDEMNIIKTGRCPFRINGTFFGSSFSSIRRVDISDVSSHGEFVVKKINEYHEKFIKYYDK